MANSFVLLDIVTADVMKGTILMLSSKNWFRGGRRDCAFGHAVESNFPSFYGED
jgi:hypothetical protein